MAESHLRRCSVPGRVLKRQLSPVETGRKSCFLSLVASKTPNRKIRQMLRYLDAIGPLETADESGLIWYRIPLGERTINQLTAVVRGSGLGRTHGPFWGIGHTTLAPGSGEESTLRAKLRSQGLQRARERLTPGKERNIADLIGRLGIPLRLLGQYPLQMPAKRADGKGTIRIAPRTWDHSRELWQRVCDKFPAFSRYWSCVVDMRGKSRGTGEAKLWAERLVCVQAWLDSFACGNDHWPEPKPLVVKPSKSYGSHYGSELRSLSLDTGTSPIPETGSDYVI